MYPIRIALLAVALTAPVAAWAQSQKVVPVGEPRTEVAADAHPEPAKSADGASMKKKKNADKKAKRPRPEAAQVGDLPNYPARGADGKPTK